MLFSAKNKLALSLILTLVFASVSLFLKHLFGLEWNLYIGEGTLMQFVLGLGSILASDLVIGFALVLLFHTAYVRLWMEMAGYFSPQRWYVILAGGMLAGSEEIFFRGVLIQCMIQILNFGTSYAVILSAAVFGLFHIIRKKRLALFSLWAFWEGIVLGAIYIYTDSLPVVAAVHAAHDVLGFTLFSLQRRRGFLPLKKHPGF